MILKKTFKSDPKHQPLKWRSCKPLKRNYASINHENEKQMRRNHQGARSAAIELGKEGDPGKPDDRESKAAQAELSEPATRVDRKTEM